MEFQGHKKAQIKKNTNVVHLYEGGAHFSYEDMYRRLEKIARILNQSTNNTSNNRNTTKTGFQGVGLNYNNGLNKNFISPSAVTNKTKSHHFGIEIKNMSNSKDKQISNLKQSDTNIVLPIIKNYSQNQINTAVTTRDSIKQRNAPLKNSLNFKDMINFYTASSENLQIYNANNSDRKIKQTKRSININVI